MVDFSHHSCGGVDCSTAHVGLQFRLGLWLLSQRATGSPCRCHPAFTPHWHIVSGHRDCAETVRDEDPEKPDLAIVASRRCCYCGSDSGSYCLGISTQQVTQLSQ